MLHQKTLAVLLIFTSCTSCTRNTSSNVKLKSPQRVVERQVQIPVGDGRIPSVAASLFHPKNTKAVLCVLLVQGSGPTDRYWNNPHIVLEQGALPSGGVIAKHLASSGMAVLAFDKRGSGQTAKDPAASKQTMFDDVKAAYQFLRAQKQVCSGSVALVGHSEGANFVRQLALAQPEVAAVVLLTAPGLSIRKILRYQIADELKTAGCGGPDLDGQVDLFEHAVSAIASGHQPAGLENLHPKAREILQHFQAAPERARQMVASWDIDPAAEISKLQMPV